MKPQWSKPAQDDLEEIRRYIAADRPLAAESWTRGLFARMDLAAEWPESGRIVPEIGDPEVREAIYGRYRILYRIHPKYILVLAVIDGSRRLRTDRISEPVAAYATIPP